jgi:hypothetical protein
MKIKGAVGLGCEVIDRLAKRSGGVERERNPAVGWGVSAEFWGPVGFVCPVESSGVTEVARRVEGSGDFDVLELFGKALLIS